MAHLMFKKRGTGKTTQLIITSCSTYYPIIVQTEQHKKYIIELAKRINMLDSMPEPMTITEYHRYGKYNMFKGVLIDDGEDIINQALKHYLGCDVISVTLTDNRRGV